AKKFGMLLGNLGIDPSSHVVVYDNKQGVNAASRFWWMLKAAGHKPVQVLNGGIQAAADAGIPVTNEITKAVPVTAYPVDNWKLPIVSLDEVIKATDDPKYLIIDVREGYRYRGESEPLDLIAGHIPNAINVPFKDNLDNDGFFLSPQQLAENYKSIIG